MNSALMMLLAAMILDMCILSARLGHRKQWHAVQTAKRAKQGRVNQYADTSRPRNELGRCIDRDRMLDGLGKIQIDGKKSEPDRAEELRCEKRYKAALTKE